MAYIEIYKSVKNFTSNGKPFPKTVWKENLFHIMKEIDRVFKAKRDNHYFINLIIRQSGQIISLIPSIVPECTGTWWGNIGNK
jgi:hypothetical protein